MHTQSLAAVLAAPIPVAYASGDDVENLILREIERGMLLTYGSINALVPTMTEDDPLFEEMNPLSGALKSFATETSRLVSTYHPSKIADKIIEKIESIVRPPFKKTIETARALKRQRSEGYLQITRLHDVDPSIAAAVAPMWINASVTEIGNRAKNANADALAVLLRMRGLVDVPTGLWDEITRRYVIAAIVEGKRTEASLFERKPSLENPFSTGINPKAVADQIEFEFENFRKRGERIEEIGSSLQQIATVLAAMTGKHPKDIFELLLK